MTTGRINQVAFTR